MDEPTRRAPLQSRSLRFWILTGMLLALAPVVLAAIGGFVLFNQTIVASFHDIADRQRAETVPAQRIGLLLWDAAISVDEFTEEANPSHQLGFRAAQSEIEAGFATLTQSVSNDPVSKALANSAQQDWKVADSLGTELVSVPRPAADPASAEKVDRFDGAIRSASDKLESLTERLEGDVQEDQDQADQTYERALWLAGIAAGVCLLTILSAVVLIGRVMSASVDRLVDGALRFAGGDRTHRIDVRIPPELRRVADEFNRMITKIHAYEDILAERALRDVLTGLPNRRAFEEVMTRNWERASQYGTCFAVLLIDVDHFKRVNDTYGHAAGDEVLRHVADALAQQLRPAHPIFRTGGEEFAVIVPNSDIAEASVVAERLRAAVSLIAVPVSGDDVRITISVGVTDSRGFEAQDAMLKAADAALYRAKSDGRNRVVAGADQRHRRESAA